MEQEEHRIVQPLIDFIATICFIKRGVAKEQPEKVVLSPAEIARIVRTTSENRRGEGDEDDDYEGSTSGEDEAMEPQNPANPSDEFNFAEYDHERVAQVASLDNVVAIDNDLNEDDDDDSEYGDEIIKRTDNLLVVGHIIDDAAALEVWVFNDEEESFYTHHDFLLPHLPLCIEWLNHDPGSDVTGNLCAIGSMDPIITIWDLDIQDSIEPAFKLGSKGNRKKNRPRYGHTDAVLDLSWNSHFPHILASGSVDKTVILWDLDDGKPHTTINSSFEDKVHTLSFHYENAQSLLTGCGDGMVRLFDCRIPEDIERNYLKWQIDSEIEKCIWNPSDGNYFLTGSCDGKLYYADIRQPKKFCWTKQCHEGEISGICYNTKIPNILTTSASDGFVKIWKLSSEELKDVYSLNFNIGRIQCMTQSPDDPFTLALGGEKNLHFRVYNIKNIEAVRTTFGIEGFVGSNN